MKIYISVDLEGIGGVTGSYQVPQAEGARPEVRGWVAAEVNAAAEAAFECGAELVLVNEHHSGKDLLLDELDPRLEVLAGKPKPLMTLQDLDSSFSAVFLLGIHARAGTPGAVLDHTWNSKLIRAVRVNGRLVGEIGLNALLAGHFGVPVALVTGDQAAVEEAQALLGRVEGAAVKRGVDRYAARLVHPSRAVEIVRAAARRTLEALPEMRPFSLGLPARLEVDLADTAMTERVCLLPMVERLSPRSVAFICEDTLRLMKDLMLATVLARSVVDPLY